MVLRVHSPSSRCSAPKVGGSNRLPVPRRNHSSVLEPRTNADFSNRFEQLDRLESFNLKTKALSRARIRHGANIAFASNSSRFSTIDLGCAGGDGTCRGDSLYTGAAPGSEYGIGQSWPTNKPGCPCSRMLCGRSSCITRDERDRWQAMIVAPGGGFRRS
jgi:hypothetical protein